MSFQVVFEVAFNSARGGYVAIDDISFSPEFCHRDTGDKEYLDFMGVNSERKERLTCTSISVQLGGQMKMLNSNSQMSLVANRNCNVHYTIKSVGLRRKGILVICSHR